MNNTTNIKNILENKINNIVKKLYNIDVNSILSIPPQKDLGDFASNVAFIISKDLQKTTQDIAHEIKDQLNENVKELIEKVEIAGPGFLNIFIKSESLFKMLLNIDNDYGTSTALHPKRIIVEMGDPNTHKAPHVGHLFSYLCGDSIARLLISQGNEIKKVTYRSDVGMGVAMCLYFWIKDGRKEPETLKDKVLLLQLCYQKGRELYEEENEKAEIIKLNSMLYEEGSTIHLDWLKTREWCLNYYKELENSLGIHSQQNYLESMVAEEGLKVVKEHIRDVFIESEGAIIFPGEKYGLHSRVFITKQGTPTYEAKDLGLVIKKMQDWPFDLTIIPTAHEQNAYFEVLIMSISKALPQYIGKIKHIGFGMVSMKTGRIRSRTGNGLNAITLIESVQKKIEILINSRDNIPENEKPDIIEKISMGAIKYAFLKSNILKDMKFDIEESISFEGNSGPYLQYTYARIQSILRSSKIKIPQTYDKLAQLLSSTEEKELALWLINYPETVKEASDTYSPHIISTYLFELSQKFNSFYKNHSVNNAETQELMFARKLLCEKTAMVLKLGLQLLGIDTVEKM